MPATREHKTGTGGEILLAPFIILFVLLLLLRDHPIPTLIGLIVLGLVYWSG